MYLIGFTVEVFTSADIPARAELEQCAAQMPTLLERNRIPPALRPYYQEWWANTQEDIHAVSKRIEAITRIWDHVRSLPRPYNVSALYPAPNGAAWSSFDLFPYP